MRLTQRSRTGPRGVLLSQACGDALGVPYEFATPPAADELAEMVGGGLGNYAPGEWSDDTQMAACIALVSATGADLTGAAALDAVADGVPALATRGCHRHRHPDPRRARAAGQRAEPAAGRLRTPLPRAYAGRNPRSAGNGALMRTAVVGLTALDDREATAAAARAVAALTHADPLAGDSARAVERGGPGRRRRAAARPRGGLDLLPAERRDQWARLDR